MSGNRVYASMAAHSGKDVKDVCISDVDLLLHPELLSQDFMQIILREKGVRTTGCENRDHLTELYLQHVIPLPQRTLPKSRWGRSMKDARGSHTPEGHRTDSNDHSRKRPLIVFDGSSSHSGPVKLKKPGGNNTSTGVTDRLKPPPAANLSNPIRRLSGTTTSSSSPAQCSSSNTSVKPGANSMDTSQSSEVKKKIQHVTWP